MPVNLVMASDIPGTHFVGNGRREPHPRRTRAAAVRLLPQVARTLFGPDIASVQLLQCAAANVFLLTGSDGRCWTVRVDAIALPAGTVARAFVNTTSENHVLQVSDRIRLSQVGRAIAHELREMLEVRRRAESGRPPPRGDLLRAFSGRPATGTLSDEDRGRLAELDWLAAEMGDTRLAAASLSRARDEFSSLVDWTGLRVTSLDFAIESAAVRSRRSIAEPLLSPPAVLALRELSYPVDRLSWHDTRRLRRRRQHCRDLELCNETAHSERPRSTERSCYPEASCASAKLVDAMRAAQERRAAVAARTLARLRDEASALPRGSYPCYPLFIGGGAALAGASSDMLVVDDRGRWQVDPIAAIVQSADQVRHIHDIGLGDPYQFAKPRHRIPLDVIRMWIDRLVSAGPAVDAKVARLFVGTANRLLAELHPLDDSNPVLVEVQDLPIVATRVTSEVVPGCSPAMPGWPDAVAVVAKHLLRTRRSEWRLVASQLLARCTDGSGAASALHVLADAGTDLMLGAAHDRRLNEALQVIEATAAWDKARVAAPGLVLYGDEIGRGAQRPDIVDEWLVAGIGGAAACTAEIILQANAKAMVRMIGNEVPVVLYHDAQYLALRRRHDVELGGDGRLLIYAGRPVGPIDYFLTPAGRPRFRAGDVEGQGYVACLGRTAQLPSILHQMRAWVAAKGGRMLAEPMFDRDRQYLGYRLVFHSVDAGYEVLVTGAASRTPPTGLFRPGNMMRVTEAGERDAPNESGNVAAGFMATVVQAVRLAEHLRIARLRMDVLKLSDCATPRLS